MSIEGISWAVKQKIASSSKLALIMLANAHTESAGVVTVTLKDLAALCGMGRTSLSDHLQRLQALGLITAVRPIGGNHVYRSNAYVLNFDKVILDGSARKKTKKKKIPQSLRTRVFERDAYRCLHCGSHKTLRCDHIIPESKGGPTSFENLQTLCALCNSKKGVSL